jgi:hypothetical protein
MMAKLLFNQTGILIIINLYLLETKNNPKKSK